MANQNYGPFVRSASWNGDDNKKAGQNIRGLKAVVDVTAVPGTDTVTVTLQGKDGVSGKYFTLLASAALVAPGTVVLTVYPGLPAAANVSANDVVPDEYRVIVTHSAGSSFTYSIGIDELG